jgi:hypothetical protein
MRWMMQRINEDLDSTTYIHVLRLQDVRRASRNGLTYTEEHESISKKDLERFHLEVSRKGAS